VAEALLSTPLADLHAALGARMVPFAGYAMPLQYPTGILAEHRACREKAALFDVSHMGQLLLEGEGAAAALERLCPADVLGLAPGRQRYGLLLNEAGGIEDDLMIANLGPRLFLVVNASRKAEDAAALRAVLPAGVRLVPLEDRALLALQGPEAGRILAACLPETAGMRFLDVIETAIDGAPAVVARSGYTGEDGFEISLPAEAAEAFARRLLAEGAQAAGLGARDSLRLEAGLCLYGADLDATTSPVEAGLVWTIGKRRRQAWDFPGAQRVRQEVADGPRRRRVGILPAGRQPARAGTPVLQEGVVIGSITSGTFGPTLDAPCAMGYVRADCAGDGTPLTLDLRGRPVAARIAPLPFVPHRVRR
jgi:aminomethyltransferase